MPARLAPLLLCLFLVLSAQVHSAHAGPLTYAACQTACNLGAVKCYALAGATFGVTGPLGGGPAVVACGLIQGTCMAACAAILAAPTP